MRIGSPTRPQVNANKELAQIRGVTRDKAVQKNEKLLHLQEVNQAYLKIIDSYNEQPVDRAQRILDKKTDDADALESLRNQKLTVDIDGHENLLGLMIAKVNEEFPDTAYSLDSIDFLAPAEKEEFIDRALSLPKSKNRIFQDKASHYDCSGRGDNFLQEAVMTNDVLTKATLDLISELKSDPESLKLFLSDRSLMESSLGILTYLNKLNQGLAADAHSPTIDLQSQISTFLEELKVKSKNDEIANSYAGLARVTAIGSDEVLINTILGTKSDKVLLTSIKQLAERHKTEPNFLSGFHYIQSNSFRNKVKAAYGSGIFGEMQATNLQARIKSVLHAGIAGSKQFRTALDRFDDNPLGLETKNAYESFIQAQREAMMASPGLNDEISKTKSQIDALDGDHTDQRNIKTQVTRDLDTAKDSLVALLETKPSDAGKTALNSLFDILIRQSGTKRRWEMVSKGSTNSDDDDIYRVASQAMEIFLNGLNECFKHFNNVNSNGYGNHNLMNLLHDRILDYILPDKDRDPENKYSVLDDLRHKLIDSLIDRELIFGGRDAEANQRLTKIRDEKNLSDLKADFPSVYEEFAKLHKQTIDDLYLISAIPYNPKQEADVKSRITNAAMTGDTVHYEILQSTFNKKTFTG